MTNRLLGSVWAHLCLCLAAMLMLAAPGRALQGQAGDAELAAARTLVEGKKYPQAVSELEKFLQNFASHPMVAQATALLATAKGGWADDLMNEGKAAQQARNEEKAVEAWTQALKLAGFDGTRAPVLGMLLGNLQAARGMHLAAAAAYFQVTRWNEAPEAPRAFLLMGDEQRLAGHTADAALNYRRGSEQHRRHALSPVLGLAAGDAFLSLKNGREAEAEFRRILRLFPGSAQAPPAQFGLGWVALLSADFQTARAAFQAAGILYAAAGYGPESNLRVADVYRLEGNLSEARARYAALLNAPRPEVAREAKYALGTVLLGLSEPGEAQAHFEALSGDAGAGRWRHAARLRLGEMSAEAGREQEALTVFLSLQEKGVPNDLRDEAQLRLGETLLHRGDVPAAEKEALALADRKPAGPFTSAAGVLVANCRLARGDASGALTQLTPILAGELDQETRAAALTVAGRAHLSRKARQEGETALTDVITRFPTSRAAPGAAQALADHYRAAGDAAKLAQIEETISKRFPTTAVALEMPLQQAEARLSAGAPAEAATLFIAILNRRPDRAARLRANAGAAEAAAALSRTADVDAHLAAIARDAPPAGLLPRTQARAARALESRKETSAALRLYEAADPAAADEETAAILLLGRGRLLDVTGHPERAEPVLRDWLARFPRSALVPEARYALGWATLNQGRVEPARAAFEELTRSHAGHPLAVDAWFRLGEISFARGEFSRAAGEYRPAAAAPGPAPTVAAAAYRLGWTLRRTGDRAGAAQAFQTILSRFPSSPLSLESRIRAAEELVAANQPAEARKLLEPALASPDLQKPGSFDLYAAAQLAAARALLLLGDPDRARQQLEALAAPANERWAGEAQLVRAEATRIKAGPAAAAAEFRRVASLFGAWEQLAAEAMARAGECWEQAMKPESARAAYQRVVDLYPGAAAAARCRERLASLVPAPGVGGP